MMIRLIRLNLVLALCSSLAFAKATESSIKEIIEGHFQPDSLKVESLLLTDEQAEELKTKSAVQLESRLFRFLVAVKAGKPMGFALIDTHKVRTKTESLLYLFDMDGKVQAVEILAFHEPSKYKPDSGQLIYLRKESKDRKDQVPLKTGATLTSYALERSKRRALALAPLIKEKL